MQDNKLELTADGSHSVRSGKFNVLYHSKHGALQESLHVFIKSGLHQVLQIKDSIKVLEMGFGTGLNLLLTFMKVEKSEKKISYHTIEAFPLSTDKAKHLNYLELLDRPDLYQMFINLHNSPWNQSHQLTEHFSYMKLLQKLQDVTLNDKYDVVYFDAFAPTTQEELWTKDVFEKLAHNLNPGSILVSYCAKGSFKRALIAAGFSIEKIPGPPGKREMIRGTYHGNISDPKEK